MRSSNALMTAHVQLLVQPQVSMGTGASNGRCSDAMTLPINNWLFHLEGGTIPPYCTLHFLPFISIGVNGLCIYIVLGCAALEKRKRKLGVHVKIYSYMNSDSSNDSNGFTSFKIICSKAAVLNPVPRILAHALHLSLSLIQIVRSAPTNCSNYTLIFTQQ